MLLMMSCAGGLGTGLPEAAVAVRAQLASALVQRDPQVVGPLAEKAAQWEGKDAELDRLIGDALGNVLMHADEGLRILRSVPEPNDPAWVEAARSAALRTGDPQTVRDVWMQINQASAPFENPVFSQVVQRMHADPTMGSARAVRVLFGCQLLDAQPGVGRKPLDHLAGPELIEVAGLLGADQVVVGRPKFRSDPDPQSGRGPIQCIKKVLLEDGWPTPLPKTLTLGLRQGDRTAFLDIKMENDVPWAYAASDLLVGGRWVRGMDLFASGKAEALPKLYPDGLWASEPVETE